MISGTARLNPTTAAFALSASITILFNTALACVKDANQPLLRWMNSIAGHNWTTQGLADLVLFFGLGMLATKAGWAENVAPSRLISFLIAAVIAATVGLAAWYALF
jgi:hypothetical protein